MKNNKTTVFLVSFFIILGVAFLAYYFKVDGERKKVSTIPVWGADRNHRISKFSFINQDGKTITNEDIKDKIVVVEYFFATCKGICPKMNENLAKVYQAFKGNKDVMILSHTVDPLKDTVAALKAYSLRFDADANQWMFLTDTSKRELYEMALNSYWLNAVEDTTGLSVDQWFIHDNHYVLVDNHGRLRGLPPYDGLKDEDVKRLIGDIKILIEEKKTK